MWRTNPVSTSRYQRGLVLFVSLIILLVLSLLAVVTASLSVARNKKIDNLQNENSATLAAESAIVQARTKIEKTIREDGYVGVCQRLVCASRVPPSLSDEEFILNARVNPINNIEQTKNAAAISRQGDVAIFAIEALQDSQSGDLQGFRIVARATAGTEATKVLGSVVKVKARN